LTRRWTDRPTADRIPFTPPADCCFDATDVQGAIDQILHIGSLVAVKIDGSAVVSFCDLVKYSANDVSIGYLYKVNG
jgi:hypothetical protein